MKSGVPYLIYPGTCREALEFYGDGGKEIMPPAHDFGMVEDRYSVRWMLAFAGEH